MSSYENQLMSEVISVGLLSLIANKILEKTLPKASPTVRLFLSGALIHLGCEFSGLNEWYTKNGAITIWNSPEKIYQRQLEKWNKGQSSYSEPSSQEGLDSFSGDGYIVSHS